MNEEEKAIKFLESKTTKYSLSGEELHYYNILYYLILNLQKENQKLKQQLEQRDNIINKTKKIIDKFYISNNFVVYDNNDITKAIIELFKILNIDKGDE